MISGAIELAFSIYAKSSKESQTWSFPLVIITMAAGYGTYMLDVKNIPAGFFHIPIVNISTIIKEVVLGIVDPVHIGITFLWSLFYIFMAFLFSKKMFLSEDVIFRS